MSNFCFVIPSYQHSNSLPGILDDLSSYSMPCTVVNDGSDEEHSQSLRDTCGKYPWVHLVEHKVNEGKGGAVISGLKKAHDLGCTHVIQIDSDGQHDLHKIKSLIQASKNKPAAVVSGQPIYDKTVPMGRKVGRYITHFWVWIETLSFKIKDSMCGFRVYPLSSTLNMLKRSSVGKRMDFDIEVLVRLYWGRVPIEYVPVKVIYPENGVSHFKMLQDNLLISRMHTRLFFGMLFRLPLLLINKMLPEKSGQHWAETDEKGMVLGIKILFFIYKFFGRGVLNFFLKIICFYYQMFAFSARRSSADFREKYYNYCNAKGVKPTMFSTFAHIYSFADSILDKLAVWQGVYDKSIINKDDLDKFNALKKTPEGKIFISAHFGNIEMARALGRDNPDKNFVALVYTENAVKFNTCLEAINGESVLNMISVKSFTPNVAIELKDRVDRGEWIFTMGDRGSVTNSGRRIEVDLLGQKALLPEGPFLLAFLLDVPIYSYFCYKLNGEVRIKFENITPAIKRSKMNRSKYITEAAQSYAAGLNDKILIAPQQWFNFFKFWKKYE